MTTKTTYGCITIDNQKAINSLKKLNYIALRIGQLLFTVTGTIAGFVMIISGGDGKYYDGDLSIAIKSCIIMIVCFAAYKFLEATRINLRAKPKQNKTAENATLEV